MMIRVNIIYEPGWVLETFARQIKKRLEYVVLQEPPGRHKINYFLPYYLLQRGSWKSIGWFTHQEEEKQDLKEKFKWAALNADFCISHSKKYAELIRKWGIKNVEQIVPGVSLERYKPIITLGYVGRFYTSTSRKNKELLNQIASIPFVRLKTTEGRLSEKQLPDFYNSLDAVFIPSMIEGGPMCMIEGLACGIPIIAPSGVGSVDEYSDSVLKYKKGDFISAKQIIKKMYQRKLKIRKEVENHTWESFAEEHDKIFRKFMG